MTQKENTSSSAVSLTLPRLMSRRGPKTLRGKMHASQNAAKYMFSSYRTKHDQDAQLLESIQAALSRNQNEAFGVLDLNAIAQELLKSYRIRCEIEATTLKCVAACHDSSDAGMEPHFKHLEGLKRYDRRSRSRLKTLIRPASHFKGLKYSNLKRSILSDDRSAS